MASSLRTKTELRRYLVPVWRLGVPVPAMLTAPSLYRVANTVTRRFNFIEPLAFLFGR
jgi:hypothetical protein